jgi:hypothetical protein
MNATFSSPASRWPSDAKRGLTPFLLLLLLAGPVGCSTVKVGEPLTRTMGGNDAEARMEFWHTLNGRTVTSNDEAFHALLLFLDDEDPAESYPQRVEALAARGMLPTGFDGTAEEGVTRGTVAVVVVRALELRGGVLLNLMPRSPRYATRELQYHGLYQASSPHQTLSGANFVAIIGRVEDYQRASVAVHKARNGDPAGRGSSGTSS